MHKFSAMDTLETVLAIPSSAFSAISRRGGRDWLLFRYIAAAVFAFDGAIFDLFFTKRANHKSLLRKRSAGFRENHLLD
jgi:hypothetical protein